MSDTVLTVLSECRRLLEELEQRAVILDGFGRAEPRLVLPSTFGVGERADLLVKLDAVLR
jgi:hypothetical protein